MAYECYLSLKGSKQGTFRGGSSAGNHRLQWLRVLKIAGGVGSSLGQSGTDARSALRLGSPITLVVDLGPATPQVMSACAGNELLTEALLEVTAPKLDGSSQGAGYFDLKNAVIASARVYLGAMPPGTTPGTTCHEITLNYLRFEQKYL